jgi:NADH-quinone oxidoreductase subunit C
MSTPTQEPNEAVGVSNDEVIDVRHGMFGAEGTGDTSGYGRLVREVTLPGSSPRPYGEYFDELVDEIGAALGRVDVLYSNAIEKVVVQCGQLTLHVHRQMLPQVAGRLRDDPKLRFELCLGVSGVHYPHDSGRELHAVYQFR